MAVAHSHLPLRDFRLVEEPRLAEPHGAVDLGIVEYRLRPPGGFLAAHPFGVGLVVFFLQRVLWLFAAHTTPVALVPVVFRFKPAREPVVLIFPFRLALVIPFPARTAFAE